MKKYNYLLLLLLPLFCLGQASELFSWETARVSNKIPMTIALKDFEKAYKKADSITMPMKGQICGTINEEGAKMVYYKGARYELDNGIMNFRELDLTVRKNMYMQQADDWFDQTTTQRSFAKTYPEAALLTEIVEDGSEDPPQIISLMPLETDSDCVWEFTFKKGKMQKIECVFSCN